MDLDIVPVCENEKEMGRHIRYRIRHKKIGTDKTNHQSVLKCRAHVDQDILVARYNKCNPC